MRPTKIVPGIIKLLRVAHNMTTSSTTLILVGSLSTLGIVLTRTINRNMAIMTGRRVSESNIFNFTQHLKFMALTISTTDCSRFAGIPIHARSLTENRRRLSIPSVYFNYIFYTNYLCAPGFFSNGMFLIQCSQLYTQFRSDAHFEIGYLHLEQGYL